MLRIIGGDLKRRKLQTPPDAKTTRPMPDHVREAVFNLLRGHFEGQAVLDAFAGSGAVGLEAVSRGAERVVLIEKDRKVARIIQRNIEELGVGDRAELVTGDALGPAALVRCPKPVHIIFFDPPYPLVGTVASWDRVRTQLSRLIGRLDGDGFAVLRTPWPFVAREPSAAEPPPPAKAQDDRPRKPSRADGRRGGRASGQADAVESFIDDDGVEMIEIEAFESLGPGDGLADAIEAEPPVEHRPAPIDLDLAIEGAEGPETHRYGSMAVHLYMRSRYNEVAGGSAG